MTEPQEPETATERLWIAVGILILCLTMLPWEAM